MSGRMVDLEINGRSKQLNPNNIAYIINRNDTVRFRGYIMLILVFTVSIIPSLILTPEPISFTFFCLLGFIISYILYKRMQGVSVRSFGTVNNSYNISGKNMNKLTSAFEKSDADSVRFTGIHKTIFTEMNYIYYITPSNVVSVDRINTNIPKIIIISFVMLSLILIGLFSYSYTGIERISGTTVGLCLLLVTVAFTISNRPDYVEIEFTNGEKRKIPLSSDEAKQMKDYLNGKKDLKKISNGDSVPEIVPADDEVSDLITEDGDSLKLREYI
jgi:hypothetical protein